MSDDPFNKKDYVWDDDPKTPTWKKWFIFAAFAIASLAFFIIFV